MEISANEFRRNTNNGRANRFPKFEKPENGASKPEPRNSWLPLTDIMEADTKVIVLVELPGMESDQVELEIENNFLTIRGEKPNDLFETDHYLHNCERYSGIFQRIFLLPHNLVVKNAHAWFKNGLLTVEIPKWGGDTPYFSNVRRAGQMEHPKHTIRIE